MIQPSHLRRIKREPGSSWKGKHLDFWLTEQGAAGEPTQWRIVVSRKVVRLATERNRWKRRMREVLRGCKESIRPGYWARFKILQEGGGVSYLELKKEMIALMKESGLWRL